MTEAIRVLQLEPDSSLHRASQGIFHGMSGDAPNTLTQVGDLDSFRRHMAQDPSISHLLIHPRFPGSIGWKLMNDLNPIFRDVLRPFRRQVEYIVLYSDFSANAYNLPSYLSEKFPIEWVRQKYRWYMDDAIAAILNHPPTSSPKS